MLFSFSHSISYLNKNGAILHSDSDAELVADVPPRDNVNIFYIGVGHRLFHEPNRLKKYKTYYICKSIPNLYSFLTVNHLWEENSSQQ